jgi:hypothetical protein
MISFLAVDAKHCRQAEHSPQLAAGSFNHFHFLANLGLAVWDPATSQTNSGIAKTNRQENHPTDY